LPIDKASMETRIDHSIQWAKRKMRLEYLMTMIDVKLNNAS